MSLDLLLASFWDDYTKITPLAKEIHDLLEKRGEVIINDHIAFRTFAHDGLNLEAFEEYFKAYGYKVSGKYDFKAKKLNAIHLENIKDPSRPKIFVSELRYKELDQESISIIEREISSIQNRSLSELFLRNDIFNISSTEYSHLSDISEYAAWLLSLGIRANHFTILVNELNTFKGLDDLNSLLLEKNIPLNKSGGIIKGSPSEYLEQTSTMASKSEIKFTDKSMSVPTCYYEFALRHHLPDGSLFHGFVTKSADKIFESTNDELVN